MLRGSTIKQETESGQVLERRMVTRRYWFEWRKDRCIGCGTCVDTCPKEAITLRAGKVQEGRLVVRPGIDIDATKCVFCGACVVTCPVHALSMQVNGRPEVPVLVWEAFPKLTQEVRAQVDGLTPELAAACVETCPTKVISIEGIPRPNGGYEKITAVHVDESDCIYCKECAVACPSAFQVTCPWEGVIALNVRLCPPGCRACVDICPTDALTWNGEQVELNEQVCIYCGACQKVCPVRGAIRVARTRILHAPIKSAAWTAALEKLISLQAAVRELEIKSEQKRRQISRFIPGAKKGLE